MGSAAKLSPERMVTFRVAAARLRVAPRSLARKQPRRLRGALRSSRKALEQLRGSGLGLGAQRLGLGSELGARGSGPRARGKLGARSSALGTWSSGSEFRARLSWMAGFWMQQVRRRTLFYGVCCQRRRLGGGSARPAAPLAYARTAPRLGLRLRLDCGSATACSLVPTQTAGSAFSEPIATAC